MDRFIVGTGRCGSTLLSRMLAENPATCSIFEYFNGLDVFRRFRPEPISGAEFLELIAAEQKVVTAVLRRGYPVAEITYPFDSGGRFRRDEPLPWVLVSMLPRLSKHPDSLFDELVAFCEALPSQPVVAHHRALFDWLCERYGKVHWIERAGSSIDYLPSLVEHFPEARFLHIHRDAYEASLSMREHHAYRVPIAILYQAAEGVGPAMSEIDFDATPTPDDPISQILGGVPNIEYFGRYWSDQVENGLRARSRIAPGAYQELRFEDLVERPEAALESIAAFFELDLAGDWVQRAASLVRGTPSARFEKLPAAEQQKLVDACRPGRALLGLT
jgi:putative sulfotransferase